MRIPFFGRKSGDKAPEPSPELDSLAKMADAALDRARSLREARRASASAVETAVDAMIDDAFGGPR